MKATATIVAMLAAGALSLSGQRVLVYSEFQRVRPDGEVVRADRVERRREILSPALARNAHATLRVGIEVPPGTPYTLHIAQNPDDTVGASLLQEEYSMVGTEWMPDRVRQVELPHTATLGEGQKVQTYLLDLWVPDTAPVARFRLEVQMWANERWTIYPMEMRVRDAMVPAKTEARGVLPGVAARADQTVMGPLREYVCGAAPSGRLAGGDTTRGVLLRNIREDLALAKTKQAEVTPDVMAGVLLMAGGWGSKEELCKGSVVAPRGAEWWLKVRDYLYLGLAVR